MKSLTRIAFFMSILIIGGVFSHAKSKNTPYIEVTEQGRVVVLPVDVDAHLQIEFPGYKIPHEAEFDPKMMSYYNRNLVGIHPAVTWGDFNGDKKRDFGFLLVTGESPWGPQIELIILNGQKKKGKFETFRLGEIYGFKDDYLRFQDGKLSKGDYKKGPWYINWNPKEKAYDNRKS